MAHFEKFKFILIFVCCIAIGFTTYNRPNDPSIYILWTLVLTVIYDSVIWYYYGKDPEPRPIVPDWVPPSDLTPLECALIDNDGEPPSNMLITHLIWLAHKKIITIVKEHRKDDKKEVFYRVIVNKSSRPTDIESDLFYHSYYLSDLIIDEDADTLLINYLSLLKYKLQRKMEGFYFYTHQKISALSTLFFPLILFYFAYPQFNAKLSYNVLIYGPIFTVTLLGLYLKFLSSPFGMFAVFLASKIISFISKYLIKMPKFIWQIIRRLILLLPSYPLIKSMPHIIPLCLVYIAASVIFSNIIFQPTKFGQRKKEKIAGLKMFIEAITSSKKPVCRPDDKYGLSMEKKLTPEDIQALFPYAVALGYEEKWQKKFKNILEDKHNLENLTEITSSFLNTLNLIVPIHPEIEQINGLHSGRFY